ncbi:MAG: replication-associated recombination protein A [Clostridia bacterium]|nr:replication-associated recombination protein A [Clostridia bacterium]
MENLFSENSKKLAPLAERMRPKSFDDFFGQEHLVKPGSFLRRAAGTDRLGSCIFFGPPGTGKTTLAHILANLTGSNFVALNAVSSGVSDVKQVISDAKSNLELYGKKTYLLLDECHRWSKAQSDCMLEAIEKGYIIFIGATTENPFISMTRAIISRCKVFEFKPLTKADIEKAINHALTDKVNGFGNLNVSIENDAKDYLVTSSGGDARVALGNLEIAVLSSKTSENKVVVSLETVKEVCTQGNRSIDEDLYYDMLSAFCKSLRGSDADAAVYWSERLIHSGCDPLLIFRRLLAHASEDVGLANSNALVVANSAMQAYLQMGAPEGLIPMSHAIIYVCMSPKSNSVVVAKANAKADVEKTYTVSVPAHLKNYNYIKEKREAYKYPHDYGGYVEQQYLPDEIKDHVYYVPSKNGSEASIKLPESKLKNITKK